MIDIHQSYKAIAVSRTSSFLALGGTAPYSWSVLPDGAGGTIDAATGIYQAPSILSSDPSKAYDMIEVTDSLGDKRQARILVGDVLRLFCEIIQSEMGLDDDHCYLWNQKINQPKDNSIYVAISVVSDRPFGNSNAYAPSGSGLDSEQFISVQSTFGIDIISRGPDARDKRYDILFALGGNYSQRQQEANSFSIGRLPMGSRFVNLSNIDGTAIPYRFHIDINVQYAYSKASSVSYFDTFNQATVVTNS